MNLHGIFIKGVTKTGTYAGKIVGDILYRTNSTDTARQIVMKDSPLKKNANGLLNIDSPNFDGTPFDHIFNLMDFAKYATKIPLAKDSFVKGVASENDMMHLVEKQYKPITHNFNLNNSTLFD